MRLLDGYNLTVGAVLAMAAEIFHQYGAVLATFLIFNIIDWITGTCKARFSGRESSVCGLKGICKKLGYWVLIFVAFMTGQNLMIMGDEMGVGFAAAEYIGWLTLTMLVVNEARSITENLVQMGVKVPSVLIRGLAIAQKELEDMQEDEENNSEAIDIYMNRKEGPFHLKRVCI